MSLKRNSSTARSYCLATTLLLPMLA